RLDLTQPFRSTQDLAQTLRLFDAVVWYRGTQGGFSRVMRDYQDGLATYLDGGGKVMIESLNLIEGTSVADQEDIGGGLHRGGGSLRLDWVSRYLGSNGLINAPLRGRADSTVSWSIVQALTDYPDAPADSTPRNRPIVLRSSTLQDSLKNNSN